MREVWLQSFRNTWSTENFNSLTIQFQLSSLQQIIAVKINTSTAVVQSDDISNPDAMNIN